MFTCSVSVYSLFAVSFLRVFFCFIFPQYSTLVAPQTRLISVVLLLLFTFIQNLFTSLTFRLCVAVSAHCLLSVFVLFIS